MEDGGRLTQDIYRKEELTYGVAADPEIHDSAKEPVYVFPRPKVEWYD